MPTKTVFWQITMTQCRWHKETAKRRTMKHWTWSMYLIRIKRHTCLTSHASHLYYCLTRFLLLLLFLQFASCVLLFITFHLHCFHSVWLRIYRKMAGITCSSGSNQVTHIKPHIHHEIEQENQRSGLHTENTNTVLESGMISQWAIAKWTACIPYTHHLFVFRVPRNCLMLNNDKSQSKKNNNNTNNSCEWMPCACSIDVTLWNSIDV